MTQWLRALAGAGEMARRLGALAALLKVLGSGPGGRMVAHGHLWWDLAPSSAVSEDSYSVLTYNNK